jgi:hypothetical protein
MGGSRNNDPAWFSVPLAPARSSEITIQRSFLDGSSRGQERWGVTWRNNPWPKNHAGSLFLIDSPEGRRRYSQRIGTVEPVFGNLRHNKRLNRFTLRGLNKVGTQWRLFCLVHNIEKLARCELQ